MTTTQDFHATAKITADQGKAALQFLDALFRGTIAEYWGQLSDVDQTAALAAYACIRNTVKNDYHMADYLEQQRAEYREIFGMLKDNWGYSHTVRYSEAGDAYLYLFENVKGTVTFIAPAADESVCVLRLRAQTQYVKEQNRYTIGWKVRLMDLDLQTVLS